MESRTSVEENKTKLVKLYPYIHKKRWVHKLNFNAFHREN